MGLDVRTLFITLTVTMCVSQGFILYLLWLGYPALGLRSFCAGGASIILGLGLIAARGMVPDMVSIVAANILVVFGYGMFWDGFRRFLERPPLPLINVLVCLATAFGLTWLTLHGATYSLRSAVVRLVIAFFTAAICRELLTGDNGKYGRPQRVLGWLYLVETFFYFFGAALDQGLGSSQELMGVRGLQSFFYLIPICYVIIWTVGLVMMIGERLQMELIAAKEAALQASGAKSEFLASMSHEMRTPLAALTGMLHLLGSADARDDQARYLEAATSSAGILAALINDVLDMSRIEAGKLTLERTVFDPRRLITEALYPFGYMAKRKGLDFSLDVAAAPGHLVGDPQRLRQVALNLAGNALKFTGQGRVAVTLSGEEAGDGRFLLRLCVEDTGIGIPADKVPLIFDTFSQVHGDAAFGGTGLGLSICRRLAEAMGGEISVSSEPGKGSRFYFTAPFDLAGDSQVQVFQATEAAAGREGDRLSEIAPMRVLLAEDFELNRLFITQVLEKAGHSVTAAENGAQAVELAAQERFDLILMDLQMPVVGGIEATAGIRALDDPAKAATPVVALTAYAFASERERCLAAGMNDHLTKPVHLDDLARILARFVPKGRPAALQAECRADSRAEPRPACVPDKEATGGLVDWEFTLDLMGGDHENLDAYCGNILNLLPAEIEVLAKALADGDMERFAVKSHSMRSLAASLGANALAATLDNAEQAGKCRDAGLAAGLLASILRDFDRILAEVAAYQEAQNSGEAGEAATG
jgi:signal transduction histidine kinase/DNA-binding NarL/FixJ family response regulator